MLPIINAYNKNLTLRGGLIVLICLVPTVIMSSMANAGALLFSFTGEVERVSPELRIAETTGFEVGDSLSGGFTVNSEAEPLFISSEILKVYALDSFFWDIGGYKGYADTLTGPKGFMSSGLLYTGKSFSLRSDGFPVSLLAATSIPLPPIGDIIGGLEPLEATFSLIDYDGVFASDGVIPDILPDISKFEIPFFSMDFGGSSIWRSSELRAKITSITVTHVTEPSAYALVCCGLFGLACLWPNKRYFI